MRLQKIRPQFVEFIPDHLEDGVLYISERFKTCSHKCCCGCGEEVVTPLSPAEWRLTREGESVSLWPSVGNWDYACRSHYVIRRNQVKWAGAMTAKQVARVRQRDAADLARLVTLNNVWKQQGELQGGESADAAQLVAQPADSAPGHGSAAKPHAKRPGLMKRLRRGLFGGEGAA